MVGTRLLDGVGHGRGGDGRVGGGQGLERGAEHLRRHQRPRGVVHDDGIGVAGGRERVSHRRRAAIPAADADAVPGRLLAVGERDDHPVDPGRPHGVERPLEHRAARHDDERLGP